jgi:hypothetical protein
MKLALKNALLFKQNYLNCPPPPPSSVAFSKISVWLLLWAILAISNGCQKEVFTDATNATASTNKNKPFFDLNFAATQQAYLKNSSHAKTSNERDSLLINAIIADLEQRDSREPFAECLIELTVMQFGIVLLPKLILPNIGI